MQQQQRHVLRRQRGLDQHGRHHRPWGHHRQHRRHEATGSTGGTTGSTGGTTGSTGGTVGTGGSAGSRGAGGSVETGGSTGAGGVSSGGSAGSASTGGRAGTGGTTATGGSTGTAGSTGSGGSVIGNCAPSNLTDTTCLPPQPAIPNGCGKVAAPRTVAPAPNDNSAGSKNAAVAETTSEVLDNALITAAFASNPCVELTTGASGANAFLIGQLKLTSGETLVIDQGVTVYASRNPKAYGASCVVIDPTGAVSDTSVTADAQYDCGGRHHGHW